VPTLLLKGKKGRKEESRKACSTRRGKLCISARGGEGERHPDLPPAAERKKGRGVLSRTHREKG